MKKRYFFLIPFVLSFCLLLCRPLWLPHWVGFVLTKSLSHQTGVGLSYRNCRKSGKSWVFEQVFLQHGRETLATIDELSIQFEWNLLHRKVHATLVADSPRLFLPEDRTALRKIIQSAGPSSSMIDFSCHVTIFDGNVLYRQENDDWVLHFQYRGRLGKEQRGEGTGFWKKNGRSAGEVLCEFHSLNNERKADIHFSHTPFSALLPFVDLVAGLPTEWQLRQGELSGYLHFSSSEAFQVRKMDGNLRIHEAEAEHLPSRTAMRVQELEMKIFPEAQPIARVFLHSSCAIQYGDHTIHIDHGEGIIDGEEGIEMTLGGQIASHEEMLPFLLKGEVGSLFGNKASLSLHLETKSQPIACSIDLLSLPRGKKTITFATKNLHLPSLHFFAPLIQKWMNTEESVQFIDGVMDATVLAHLKDGAVIDFTVPQFEIRQAHIQGKRNGLQIARLSHHGTMNLTTPLFWEGLSGSCQLEDVRWIDSATEEPFCTWKGLLSLERGVVQSSNLLFSGKDMEGQIDWISPHPHEVIRLYLRGKRECLQEISPALSEKFPSFFQEGQITGFFSPNQEGLRIDGEIFLLNEEKCCKDRCSFGCDFSVTDLPTPLSMPKATHLFANPQISFPFAFLYSSKEEKWISWKGWFETNSIDAKEYHSLLPDEWKIEGVGKLIGEWDPSRVTVRVEGKDLVIDGKAFHCSVPYLHEEEGEWVYSIPEGKWKAEWNLSRTQYLEKNTGLLFVDSRGLTTILPDSIRVKHLETSCGGLHLKGELSFNGWGSEQSELAISAESCEGTLQDCKHLCSPFDALSKFSRLPLEGSLHLCGEGFRFLYRRQEDGWKPSFYLEGMIDRGRYSEPVKGLNFCDLQAHLHFDSDSARFALPDMSGVVWFGNGDPSTLWNFSGQGEGCFASTQDAPPFFDFLFSLMDDEQALVSFKGNATQNEGDKWDVCFDLPHTHFGPFHPTEFLFSWGRQGIENFSFHLDFALAHLLEELSRWKWTNQPFFSQKIQNLAGGGILQGNGALAVRIPSEEEGVQFDFSMADIEWKGRPFDRLSVKGRHHGSQLSLEHFSWREFSGSADLVKENKEWRIPFLGLQIGDQTLVGIEGGALDEKEVFSFSLPMMEVNLEELAQKGRMTLENVKGILRGKGAGTLTMIDHAPFFRLTTVLSLGGEGMEWKGFSFDLTNFPTFVLDTEEGFSLEKMVGSFSLPQSGEEIHFPLSIDEVRWTRSLQELSWEGLRFQAASSAVRPLLDALSQNFSLAYPLPLEAALSWKSSGKWSGTIKGNLNAEGNYSIETSLDASEYVIEELEIPCRSLIVTCEPQEIKCLAHITYQQKLFWISGSFPLQEPYQGQILVTEHDPRVKPFEDIEPFTLSWKNLPETGWQVDRIAGSFSGMDFRLERAEAFCTSNQESFHGAIGLNWERLSPLFPLSIARKIREWKMGEGYRLEGTWYFSTGKEGFSLPKFSGNLLGEKFSFYEYLLDGLKANITFTGDELVVEDLQVWDRGLRCSIPLFVVERKQHWMASCPAIDVQNLRPSLLFSTLTHARGPMEPLLVQKIHAEGIRGDLNEGEWDGTGSLTFIHDSPSLRENPLFAIPSEIILRLGLDPNLFTPVRGKILYRLRGDKILLQKFKDMYSDGKGSRFYLARTKEDSWMDFDGNLHILIGMKHYNLFFKLAELFTVKMEGTLREPVYSLSRQKRS